MEKQDPWLRAACYVVEKHIAQIIDYTRIEINDLLSQSKNNDKQKILFMKKVFKDNNIPRWFDDILLRDTLFKEYAGELYWTTHDNFRELYADSIKEYRINITKLNLIYNAVQTYLSDITKTVIHISVGNEHIAIKDKQNFLNFLSIINMPEHIIHKVEDSTLTLEESEYIKSIDEDSLRFQSSCYQFIVTILDPIIAKREEEILVEYNKESIENLSTMLLDTISNNILTYQNLLETVEESSKEWKDLQQIIKEYEAFFEETQKNYWKELKQAQRIKELLDPFKLLRESMIYSSRSGKPFVFLKSEYCTDEDIVLLADILLYEYKLKNKFPKWQKVLWNLKRYVNSYKK
jgi:archaellum component FlaG (FlaF/FlaG flagellin family)